MFQEIETKSRERYLLYESQFPYLCYMNIQINATCALRVGICTFLIYDRKNKAEKIRKKEISKLRQGVFITASCRSWLNEW